MSIAKHLFIEFNNCDEELLNNIKFIKEMFKRAGEISGSLIVDPILYKLSPTGIGGIIICEVDAHIQFSTYPPKKYVLLDFLVSQTLMAPWLGINFLKEAFKAGGMAAYEFKQGLKQMVAGPKDSLQKKEYMYKDAVAGDDNLFVISTPEKPLFTLQSKFQKIEIINTPSVGKILLLDNAHNISGKEEFIYHEMMIHPPLLVHPNPLNILVIGAGDGGCLREIFKHKDIERVVMVEIDVEVINACKMHFPQVACEFGNPKLELIIGEGSKYVSQCADQSFDIIIVDSTDNVEDLEGISTVINGEAFYKDCLRILTKNGIIVTQAESWSCMLQQFSICLSNYFKYFGNENVFACNFELPSLGGQSFSFCTKGNLNPWKSLDKARIDAFVEQTKLSYYSYDMHLAAYTLPKRMIQLLKTLKYKE